MYLHRTAAGLDFLFWSLLSGASLQPAPKDVPTEIVSLTLKHSLDIHIEPDSAEKDPTVECTVNTALLRTQSFHVQGAWDSLDKIHCICGPDQSNSTA